ncbi:MAG: hypothetical protein Kow0047_20570 [Anaerolineae bacterium]
MCALVRALFRWGAVIGATLIVLSIAWPRAPAGAQSQPPAPHVPGEILAGLRGAPGPHKLVAMADELAADYGAQVIGRIPALHMVHLRVDESRLEATLARLQSDRRVTWAEPNYTIQLDLVPNDPLYSTQSTYLDRLQVETAWDATTGSPDIVVAVLDTGVDLAHPDLSAGIWTNPGEIPGNGLDDDENGFVDDVHGWDFADDDNDPTDDHGHGTHVAGIIAARTNNGIGIAGMAGQVTILPVDIFSGGIGTYADLIQGIVYAADNGARVINMSLGALSYSRGEEAAVAYATERGALCIAASGNQGLEVWHYPAAHPQVIAVGAVDSADQRAGFSNYGPYLSLTAPGVQVTSTLPGNRYGWLSGTSMATPHVSGVAALILSLNPFLSPAEVRAILESTADDLGAGGWDPQYGYGRVNAAAAVAAVPSPPTPSPTPSPTPPPVPLWPDDCEELIQNGSLEAGPIDWELSGVAAITSERAYQSTWAIHLAGEIGQSGQAYQELFIPSGTQAASLHFMFRIEDQDGGHSGDPQDPSRDHLRAEFQDLTGQTLISLLRTGNAGDSVREGLPWDEYLYALSAEDLTTLRQQGRVRLLFYGDNGPDSYTTDFYIDDISLCASVTRPYRYFFPIGSAR